MSPEDISLRKKTTSTKQTDEMEEDGTTGMINIWKNLKNNVSNEKYVSIKMSQMQHCKIINSYHIHVLRNL